MKVESRVRPSPYDESMTQDLPARPGKRKVVTALAAAVATVVVVLSAGAAVQRVANEHWPIAPGQTPNVSTPTRR